jgi:hypothetical protein
MDDALYTMRRRAELPESEVYMVWGELGEWGRDRHLHFTTALSWVAPSGMARPEFA